MARISLKIKNCNEGEFIRTVCLSEMEERALAVGILKQITDKFPPGTYLADCDVSIRFHVASDEKQAIEMEAMWHKIWKLPEIVVMQPEQKTEGEANG